MPELRQEYLDILEKREWSVSGYTDDGRVELEWWSPAGEDFLVCVNVENFPDEILDYSDDFDPDEHIEMWVEARANGRQDVPGARYKALGNSIAIPPWKWVLKRLCAIYERDATMASLFDGIGGFPYIWEQLNGKGSCLWASEIEPFPIAVTKYHFGEE